MTRKYLLTVAAVGLSMLLFASPALTQQAAPGNKNILVDLKDVRFIDSSGLGALVSGFKNAISHQGNLKLSSLQPQVKSMFELTRLHRVFEIFASTSEALDNY